MNGVEAQIDRYLAQVSGALADLPADVREELVEDLPAHLAEVLAEDNGSLEERLGPPEAYAAELRAAAGVDRPAAARRFDLRATELARWLRLADRKVGKLLGYERSSDFFALLRPAWWIVRGWVIGMLLLGAMFADPGPLPDVHGNRFVGWLLVLAVVVLSVRLGPLLPRAPVQLRPFLVILGVALAGLIFVNVAMYDEDYHLQRTGYDPGPDRYGHISDVFPVDKYGNPLTDVQLYDQRGNPITIGRLYECPSAIQATRPSHMYPLCHTHAGPSPSPSASPSPSPSPSPSRAAEPSPSR